MPGPEGLPTGIWEAAEMKEMEDVVGLYGKTYHFWQVDRGDKLPLGEPQLMMSFTERPEGFEELLGKRDERYGVDSKQKAEKRGYIEKPEIHKGEAAFSFIIYCMYADRQLVDADSMWKNSNQ